MAIMKPMKRPMQKAGKKLAAADAPGHVKMPDNVKGGPGITAPWLVKVKPIQTTNT